MKKTLSICNDVPDNFLQLFAENGPFSQLVEDARAPGNSIDLQFRNTQGTKPWATLYLGTSKIVDIYFSDRRGLMIKPQKSKKLFREQLSGFWERHPNLGDQWDKWESIADASESWASAGADLIETLGNAESEASGRTGSGSEGYLQAGIAKPGFFDRWSIINRESIVSFENKAQRRNQLQRARKPVDVVVESIRSKDTPWARSEKHFGNKLDALGIDNDGNLLAIEVKGGYATAGVGWTPAQVVVYKRLLQEWLEETTEDPQEVLGKSLRQRQSLGLAGSQELAPDFKIIPVIVIGEIKSKSSAETATQRMNEVWDALDENGNDLKDLRIFQLEGTDLHCFEIGRGEPLRSV